MTRISDYSPLAGSAVDTAVDLFEIVDMSETGAARNKKIPPDEVLIALSEGISDLVAGLLTEGSNITLTYDDGAGTLTIEAAAVGTGDIADFNEAVDDRIAALLQEGTNITLTYNDGAGTLTIDAAGGGGSGTVTSVATAGLATGGPITGTGTVTVTAATASDINTGTDTTKALTADALAGSNFGKQVVTVLVTDPAGSAITTGDGKAYYPVPSTLNGMNLVAVAAYLTTTSSSGIPTVQIANVTQAADMLSTKLTIDASELTSATAAAAAVVDTGNDDVATGDILRIDIDVAGTGAKGLMVEMQFQLP